MNLTEEVRAYWEREPCGTGPSITGELEQGSKEWFEQVEQYRYAVEPFIHSIAQFTRYRGKKLLEVGVGAGTDHLQWARAGAECHGVDLTDAAIRTTEERLRIYGLRSSLQRVNAQALPFDDETFDVVYSWGVIHHSDNPAEIISEILRVLKPGGQFIGMLYGRRSVTVVKLWVRYALLKGKPWLSPANVVWNRMESVGTKSYTVSEVKDLFSRYSQFEAIPTITAYDLARFPRWMSMYFPDSWGWYIGVRATK
jgi:ubiquinone/menaquinone biosynthesis C-methylase UbiE